MGFFKTLFSGKEETPADNQEKNQEREFDVLKYDGLRALKIGETQYAIRCFDKALAIRKDEETMNFLAQAQLQNHDTESAYNTLSQIAESASDPSSAYISMAKLCDIQQNFQRMDEICTKGLQVCPQQAELLYWSGKAKHALLDEFQAIAMLTRAIQQDGNLLQAYMLRAEILCLMNSLNDAEADIDFVLQHSDENEEAMMIKADINMKKGQIAEAIEYYEKVKALNPLLPEAYVKLSTAYAANHQLDQSLNCMNEAVEFMPDSSECYKERGRVKLLLNDKAGAMDDVKKALECNPNAAQALDGKYSNIEQEMNDMYKTRNPYGF